ncbi:LPS translocon maturation chaperone LptM [Microbulbifer sp. 2304DJ12-6]|uniref:LPS translocon maturation chaperone LptM n=1 Tax=Microbulbifer sp. 2304DJ12-6 TaxID=3233340 RepID=UPI00261CD43D|nr:lipoprotein [uncultured Microbulbifer sp.]
MSKTPFLSLLALLASAGLATSCGQKGPLYLPQAPASPAPSITTGPPSTAPTSNTATQPGESDEEDRKSAEDPAEQETQK